MDFRDNFVNGKCTFCFHNSQLYSFFRLFALRDFVCSTSSAANHWRNRILSVGKESFKGHLCENCRQIVSSTNNDP